MNNQNAEQEVKVVRKYDIAKRILGKAKERGLVMQIVDIKPDKTDPDRKRSVFVFLNTPEFQDIFTEVLEENKKRRATSDNMDEMIEREVQRRVDAAIEERFKKIEKFAEV